LCVIPIGLLVVAWRYGVFNIHEVVVEGCVRTSDDSLEQRLDESLLDELIFAVTSKEVEGEVLGASDFPYVETVTVEKALPDKVVVRITEKTPYVCLLGLGTIDAEGSVILGNDCDASVPSIVLQAKEVDVNQIGAALRIKAALTQQLFPVDSVTLLDYGDIIIGSGNLDGYFSLNAPRSVDAQSSMFLEIYNSNLNQDRRLVEIDVRFDKAYTERAQ